ncbi:MAG: DUF1573 domain-containing protein [Bacteroidales bacterium]|nr:DUF1573 domain-containing protein [Bacteroidales bacterium]
MKKTILAIALFPALAWASPKIQMAETTHDYGTIQEMAGPQRWEVEFQNTGDEPLVIISASASCGCTQPTYPKEPIKPGKTGKIKVTYIPQGHSGEFNKEVKIRTNDPKQKKVTLKITGTVIPASKKK